MGGDPGNDPGIGGAPITTYDSKKTAASVNNAMAVAMAALIKPDCAKVFGYDVFSGTGKGANPYDILNTLASDTSWTLNNNGWSSNNLFYLQVGPAGWEQMPDGSLIPLNATTATGTADGHDYAIITINSY